MIPSLFLFLALSPIAQDTAGAPTADEAVQVAEASFRHAAPTELFDVTRVVDGDTIWIDYRGKTEKLRLLSVDTEERFDVSPTKPATVFGEECALWAEEFFAALEGEDGTPARVGLAFPGGKERRDVYGRLLCHVVLPDGIDFNLLLVQRGKSPYFNKYGHSQICHAQFAAAQKKARENRLGIWHPDTNKSDRAGAPAATRPYEELLVWWQCRADAIDRFRERAAEAPDEWIDAEDPEALARAEKSGAEVKVFCAIARTFDEENGSKTVLMRSGDKARSLRVLVAPEDMEAHATLDLERFNEEFRQNYLYVTGTVVRGARGFELHSKSPDQWRPAGPDPVLPK